LSFEQVKSEMKPSELANLKAKKQAKPKHDEFKEVHSIYERLRLQNRQRQDELKSKNLTKE